MKALYARWKQRVFSLIRDDDENSLAAQLLDGFIITLILLNVGIVIAETFEGIPPGALAWFRTFELFSVSVFTLEYLLRLWTADLAFPDRKPYAARFGYVFSFMALVDLFAILPFYLPFLLPADLLALRALRLLRLLRILKINRYTKALSTVGSVLKKKSPQLLSSLLVVIVLMIIASILLYNAEHAAQPTVFANALSGLWWAATTLTTVGYGDIYPMTVGGKIIGALIAFLGVGLIAIPTGILSSGFMEHSAKGGGEEKEEQAENEQKCFCPYCGKRVE